MMVNPEALSWGFLIFSSQKRKIRGFLQTWFMELGGLVEGLLDASCLIGMPWASVELETYSIFELRMRPCVYLAPPCRACTHKGSKLLLCEGHLELPSSLASVDGKHDSSTELQRSTLGTNDKLLIIITRLRTLFDASPRSPQSGEPGVV